MGLWIGYCVIMENIKWLEIVLKSDSKTVAL